MNVIKMIKRLLYRKSRLKNVSGRKLSQIQHKLIKYELVNDGQVSFPSFRVSYSGDTRQALFLQERFIRFTAGGQTADSARKRAINFFDLRFLTGTWQQTNQTIHPLLLQCYCKAGLLNCQMANGLHLRQFFFKSKHFTYTLTVQLFNGIIVPLINFIKTMFIFG